MSAIRTNVTSLHRPSVYNRDAQGETAVVADSPVESRIGWVILIIMFSLLFGVATFVQLDAAAHAEGLIKVAGSRQVVQHRDGGTVAALRVREGQHVQVGQVLIELAGNEAKASERALSAQVIGLQSERARLVAEQGNKTSLALPSEFAQLAPEDRLLADEAMRLQFDELGARRQALVAQKSVLRQQSAQLSQRINGISRQVSANDQQSALYADELSAVRALAAKGYVSRTRLRAVERENAAMFGQTAGLTASIAAAREQIGETRMQALSLDAQRALDTSQRLREIGDQLGEAMPKWVAMRQQLEQTRIRATASGQVVGLTVFTVGGVIAPGERLMEIVPDARPVVIEAKIAPDDADDLYVGQRVEVRVPALKERDLPVLTGQISRLSADSFADERTGVRFFTGEVTVPVKALRAIQRVQGGAGGFKPGLPAEILVPLRQRTALQYLLEPFNQALWRSGHEH